MKKYLITGSSGFVAKYFINYLEQKKIECAVLAIDTVNNIIYDNFKYVFIKFDQIDLLNRMQFEKILYDFNPDYILHLASYSSVAYSWKNPLLSFQNNTNIFLNVVDAVRVLNLKSRIISVGSSEQYGNINKENLPLKEEYPLDPVSPYAVARTSQEMISKIYSAGFNTDIIITRSFNHIGPTQKEIFVVPSFAKQIAGIKKSGKSKGKIITGDLSIIRDFLDVRDVVKAYYLLFERGIKGDVYNVCSGKGISLQDVVNKMAEIAGIEIEIEVNPDFIRPNDNKIIIGSNNKIKRDTGWGNKISLDNSIKDIYRYWINMV
jgi:GDP-4-dehydro-6-deoxy-D-mannose reductase